MGMIDLGLGFGVPVLLIDLAFAWHIIRTGRSPLWIMAIALGQMIGWIAYIVFAILPDMARSNSARRFADNMVSMADPGRDYREKLRNVEQVGSVDSKRALAEECIRMGRFADAVELYESAMQGPLGASDPTLLKGMGRARMLSGDGAAAESLFVKLKVVDPAAYD